MEKHRKKKKTEVDMKEAMKPNQIQSDFHDRHYGRSVFSILLETYHVLLLNPHFASFSPTTVTNSVFSWGKQNNKEPE